jgi:hypothetical protein
MNITRLLVIASLTAAAGCGSIGQGAIQGGPVAQGPGSLTEARKFLQGRWTLESFVAYPPGAPPVTLAGQGTLTYDDFGNLRIEIRAEQASADLLRAAGVDIRDGIISSDGRVVVDMQHQTIAYIIDGQPAAGTGPLATSRLRHWQVEGDVLILTTRTNEGTPASVGRWRRSQ